VLPVDYTKIKAPFIFHHHILINGATALKTEGKGAAMKRINFTMIIVSLSLMGLLPLPALAHIPSGYLNASEPTLAPLLERVTPAVVNIAVRGHVAMQSNPLFNDPFFHQFFNVPQMPVQREFKAAGSGVIINAAKGYVLTNNHVVKNADKVVVSLKDGRKLTARVLGTDAEADIAVLQIPSKQLTALPLGDSNVLQVGDFVVAVGNPFGLGQTVTSGIVSALGRSGLGIEGYENFIQTDASINPGNSGGALVNLRGELIGINTAIVAPSGGNVGIGFAIPINMAKAIAQQLIKTGKVERGYLGISIQDMTPDIAKVMGVQASQGAIVSQVNAGSAADKAGLKAGDIITAVNGKAIKNTAVLRNRIGLIQPGGTVTLNVIRDGMHIMLTATLKSIESAQINAGELDSRLAGAVFVSAKKGLSIFNHVAGVRIQSVQQGSPAWQAGLRTNDIIIAVNRNPVHSPEELAQAAHDNQDTLVLNIERGNITLLLLIR